MLSSVVSSQVDLHARFGGVVPEVASRAHVELITPVIAEALVEAGVELSDLDAVAACHGPGLAGALLVGVSAAKALALVGDLPYVGVNHLEAHLHAAWLEEPDLEPPLAVLIVSGGHTMTVVMEAHGRYRVVGQTVDDAAGEAFDKVARHLGLGYPGGPVIDRLARDGDADGRRASRGRCRARPTSRSPGSKTAVVNHHRQQPDAPVARRGRVVPGGGRRPAGRQAAGRGGRARARPCSPSGAAWPPTPASGPRWRRPPRPPGGGCSSLRPELCTDNGAMIAATAWWRLRSDGPTPLDAGADPNLRLG